jgi:hypothetical protein
MIESRLWIAASTRGRTLFVAMASIAPLVGSGVASPALAKSPTGDFAVFSRCPRSTPEVEFCLYSQTTSGEVTLGRRTVPIVHTITIQGGIEVNKETDVETFVGALNGETVSRVPQNIPGGLSGLVKCDEIGSFVERSACEGVFRNGSLGVYATTELARPAGEIGISTNNLVNREGTALSLPLKMRLTNPFLGNECYIGSSSNPVTFNLTTGTTSPWAPNRPISGKVGGFQFKDDLEFVEISKDTLVDNSFSAPEAAGCGGIYSFLIDPIIDRKIGLPSAAGHNTAILNNALGEATTVGVIASEK